MELLKNYKFLMLLSLWIACFHPLYSELANTWLNHSNNSHGLLVPFISLYFIYEKKEQLGEVEVTPFYLGAVFLLISMAGYLISLAGGIAFIARIMLVLSLISLILFALGKEVFKVIFFPLFFLLFMVPIPESFVALVSLPLQGFATTISAAIIKAFSIPVYQEGNMLYFAQTQLEVAQACSGIRSIVSLTMLSFIFVYLSKRGFSQKLILLLSAIPIALIANIIRVSGTGILAHFYGSIVAQGFLHEFSGLAVFVFGFLVLMLEFSLLNKYAEDREREAAKPPNS